MIPVTQTKFAISNKAGERVQYGNCYAAAIASMLEVQITDVPNVEIFAGYDNALFYTLMDDFLKLKGYIICPDNRFKMLHIGLPEVKFTKEEEENMPENVMDQIKDTYYFVTGPSSRGVNHIVIYKNGVMVHDPHPSRDGLLKLEEFFCFEKL